LVYLASLGGLALDSARRTGYQNKAYLKFKVIFLIKSYSLKIGLRATAETISLARSKLSNFYYAISSVNLLSHQTQLHEYEMLLQLPYS